MSSELFDGLDRDAQDELRARMRPHALDTGEVLFHAGEPGDSLYVVESGLFQVVDGSSGAVLGRQRSGDVVGEVALLTGESRSATLVAQVPSVVAELTRETFLSVASHHPMLLANLAAIVSRRLVARTAAPAGRITAVVTPPAGWEGEAAVEYGGELIITQGPDEAEVLLEVSADAPSYARWRLDGPGLGGGGRLAPGEATVALACDLAGRNPTFAEWETHVGDTEPYVELCPGFPTADQQFPEVAE